MRLSDFGVCQSSEAAHHFTICSGAEKYFHTFSTGAFTVVSTVMLVVVGVSMFYFLKAFNYFDHKHSYCISCCTGITATKKG